MTSKTQLQKLFRSAQKAAKNAHAPYSGYNVGCALLTKKNEMFTGCNIENASYGGTVCAERVALWNAVSQKKSIQVTDLVVYTKSPKPWPPCGFCRQVMSEFLSPNSKIHLANDKGIQATYTLDELLPLAFKLV